MIDEAESNHEGLLDLAARKYATTTYYQPEYTIEFMKRIFESGRFWCVWLMHVAESPE